MEHSAAEWGNGRISKTVRQAYIQPVDTRFELTYGLMGLLVSSCCALVAVRRVFH
jgi:hypothetical protein